MKNYQLIVIVTLLFGCTNYSTGERIGTIVKFSEKGFMYKTWEGQINLGGLKKQKDKDNNTSYVANTFEFSLDRSKHRNETISALVDTINKAVNLGLPVKVHYNQEQFTNCMSQRGETDYFVDKVTILY